MLDASLSIFNHDFNCICTPSSLRLALKDDIIEIADINNRSNLGDKRVLPVYDGSRIARF